ncbi:MAG: hypothetical protein MZV49_24905 [Rhodopseudomonas palustris]|nr:hypothetical protein [Rhodopseudomonas palustris]
MHPFENLLIDCARDVGATVILRGLRAVARFRVRVPDGRHEPGARCRAIETVFLMADARRQAIASKLVKEIARLGERRLEDFVTPDRGASALTPQVSPDIGNGPGGPAARGAGGSHSPRRGGWTAVSGAGPRPRCRAIRSATSIDVQIERGCRSAGAPVSARVRR